MPEAARCARDDAGTGTGELVMTLATGAAGKSAGIGCKAEAFSWGASVSISRCPTREVEHLRSLPSERDRLDYVVEDLEESYFADHEEYIAQSDKAWDAIHRAHTMGS